MKKLLTILAILLGTTLGLKAQQGEIIYVDSPSPNLLHPNYEPGYAFYDFDGNGTQDLWIGVPNYYWYCVRAYTVGDMQFYYKNGWDQFVNFGDTLSSMPEWCWRNAPEDPWGEKTSKDGPTIIVDYEEDVDSVFIGVRKPVEGGYCYGWMRISTAVDNAPYPDNNSKCFILDYAFCTDPNYPFRAGQTSFTWGTNENEMKSFASVYPNPANGVLFVEMRRATSLPEETPYRITNIMGQTVLSGDIAAETQQINIASLPAGMYFIIFAGETRKFVVK